MKTKQDFAVKYFLTRSLFLGLGFSIIFNHTGSDAWISTLLGILLGIILIYIISFINTKIPNSLHDYLQKKEFLNILIKIVLSIFYLFYMFILLIIIATFLFSYYLPFTPTLVSVTPFLFLAILLANKGIKNIGRVARCLFYINVITTIIIAIFLSSYIVPTNYFPIMVNTKLDIFMGAFVLATISTAPYLISLGDKKSFKDNIKPYLFSCIFIIIMILVITGIFGNSLTRIFSYPEYSILRKIQLLNFIENVENIIAIILFFDSFIGLTYTLLKTKEIITLKNKVYLYIIAFTLMILVSIFIISNYISITYVYKGFTIIMFILMICIFILFLFKNLKKGSKY